MNRTQVREIRSAPARIRALVFQTSVLAEMTEASRDPRTFASEGRLTARFFRRAPSIRSVFALRRARTRANAFAGEGGRASLSIVLGGQLRILREQELHDLEAARARGDDERILDQVRVVEGSSVGEA